MKHLLKLTSSPSDERTNTFPSASQVDLPCGSRAVSRAFTQLPNSKNLGGSPFRGCTQCPSELDDFQNRRTSTRPSHSTSISPVEKGFCSKKRVDLPTQRRTGKHFVLQSRRIPLSGFKFFLRPIENQLKTGRLQAFDSTCALGGVPVPTLGSRKDISEKV